MRRGGGGREGKIEWRVVKYEIYLKTIPKSSQRRYSQEPYSQHPLLPFLSPTPFSPPLNAGPIIPQKLTTKTEAEIS